MVKKKWKKVPEENIEKFFEAADILSDPNFLQLSLVTIDIICFLRFRASLIVSLHLNLQLRPIFGPHLLIQCPSLDNAYIGAVSACFKVKSSCWFSNCNKT